MKCAPASMTDHDYNLQILRDEVCDESDIEEMVRDSSPKSSKINLSHTPIKGPNPKKQRGDGKKNDEPSDSVAILHAIQVLTSKVDGQTALLKNFEKKIEMNTAAINENKEDIAVLQKQVDDLRKVNKTLRSACDEHARYKRRWNLRLTGLTEKEGENTREIVIGILTRVVPLSVDRLRDSVDTVHRLGKRNDPATSNNTPRAIIIQFGMRNIRDEVWKKSRDAKVCSEMHIRFKEDFSSEDRVARAKLWPLVQEARRNGKRACLKEGYALIDNRRVDPD